MLITRDSFRFTLTLAILIGVALIALAPSQVKAQTDAKGIYID